MNLDCQKFNIVKTWQFENTHLFDTKQNKKYANTISNN